MPNRYSCKILITKLCRQQGEIVHNYDTKFFAIQDKAKSKAENTNGLFYRQTQQSSCHGLTRRIQALYAIKEQHFKRS
jgi:hypothetical protein